ncbi:DNA topoisomerase 2 [Silene latifolia]|uniref:DNA topoisomerase 2 n=1 Tax=Silene latifolia TaxID=37657 RepID=UPI003D77038B
MPPKKLPLQSSNNVNIPDHHPATTTGKTIEEMYQKKTQLEHILLRPDTYIGSVQKHDQSLWVYNPESHMEYRSVSYVPGLYKIFDEILVNAADNKQRDSKMDRVEVVIDQEANFISVYNTGDGIPVEMHKEEGVFVPELIFGHLLTSSNYDDMEKKTTGGRNGYGAKLTNIFSTEFVIETADGKRQLKYKQVFTNNMSNKGNPVTSKCKASDNWTKVSFKPDLAKFNMTHLEDDVVALMKKRVVDLAGCLSACPGKKVRVFLNEKEIEVKSFHDYAQFYLNSANENREVPLPRIDNNSKEDINPRWQISVSRSEGQFQQVSFVNNINTIKGGTHVDYITAQITKFIIDIVKKKNKNANLKPHIVKNHLWIFVNALIDNPAFDSQTKETLTTRANSFGTTCDLSDKFLKKVVDSSGVVESLLSWAEFKQNKDLKKTDGAKTRKIFGIPKLEDANEAGGSRSHECTLILTEGDSAKALAMAGLSVVGRNFFGVFPLRGKLLNVREASAKQISENAEINNIKKILGLKQGESYDKESSVKQLRYGHLMIMADQDHDGSHIKGLLINFIHTFWPSLLRKSSFMLEFVTPIVKAVHGKGKDKKVVSFYSMPEYEEWVKNTGADVKKWTVKYYKGLGTSDSNEGREYFSNLKNNRKVFVWSDDKDGDAIELAFSKKKIDARKDWLREEENGSYLDHAEEMIKYTDFVHKELKLFSRADLQRSIPSMVDGLKPTQRKVLFCAFKKNLVHEIKVAQFSGYVSEKSAYHHGEVSIQTTIVGMAQDFVGSNNVNLLMPNGQFGTRNMGGKDAASARYIHTKLADVTRSMFPKEDDVLLDYLKEDGLQIEPVWYMPIIPMVLVNGSEGIGTGWSTFIPNYNPKDIIANIRRLINNEPLEPMDPWYKNFKGSIQRAVSRKESGVTYTVTGTIDVVDGDVEGDDEGEGGDGETDVKLRITELPIRKWTQDYKEFVENMIKDGFIKDEKNLSSNEAVIYDIVLSKRNYNLARQEGLAKKFKLTTSLATSNMHLFDKDNKIVKYDSPEQILEEFYHLRLKYYIKRKERYLEIYQAELVRLDNQVRFILGVVEGEIIVCKRKKAELVAELRERGFTPIRRVKPVEPVVGATEDEVAESSEELGDSAETGTEESLSDYDYLLSMAISSLTIEKVKELCANKDKVLNQIEDLKKQSEKSLWWKDLDGLEKALDEKDKREAEEASANASISKDPTKKPTRNVKKVTKAKPKLETTSSVAAVAMETENPPQAAKGKAKAVPKKAPAKKGKTTVVESEEEDEDIPDLRARLAAYHLDSSPENSAVMETDAPPKQAASKDTLDFVQEISDEEVASPKPVKKGRGGKTQQPAATKKRAPARKGQKPVTDEMVDASPDKKVRKTRPLEVTKMRSSSLNSIQEEPMSAESVEKVSEVMPPARARPARASRKQTTYILSDSDDEDAEDSDDVEELSDSESEDDD